LAHQIINILNNYLLSKYLLTFQTCKPCSVASPATIPPEMMLTSYCPDLVFYNTATNSIALLEFTCPLDSMHHLESARSCKQNKLEYQQLLADLDCLNIMNETLEISVLGHYHPFCKLIELSLICSPGFVSVKNSCKENFGFCLAEVYNGILEDNFMARDCCEWFPTSPD